MPTGRHYLDHASTSPLRPAAAEAMHAWLDEAPGDPGRMHEEAMFTRAVIEDARDSVAAFLGARPREVVFTSGATESIAMAVGGAAERGGGRVVSSAVEHSAVLSSAAGWDHHEVGVDEHGRIEVEQFIAAVTSDTAVANLQLGNHEVGTIQPIDAVGEHCRDLDVLLHVDAAQAAGRIPISFSSTPVDLMSVSGHKLGGPTGIGVLLIRRGLRIPSLLVGGDQERARRAGLENSLAIVGLAAACASIDLRTEATAARTLRDQLLAGVAGIEGLAVFGDPRHHLPHLLCLGIDDVEPQAVLLGLDRRGIAAHSGSACSSEALEPSPVLEAMGLPAQRSLRFSVGWNTTSTDIEMAIAALTETLADLRGLAR